MLADTGGRAQRRRWAEVPGWQTVTRGHRLAAAATVANPITVAALALWTAMTSPQTGLGLFMGSARPLEYIGTSLFGMLGWLLGTSMWVAIFIGPTLLPGYLHGIAVYALIGSPLRVLARRHHGRTGPPPGGIPVDDPTLVAGTNHLARLSASRPAADR